MRYTFSGGSNHQTIDPKKTCKLPLKKLSTMCVHINLIAPIAANGSSGSYVIYLKSSIQSSFILNEREKKNAIKLKLQSKKNERKRVLTFIRSGWIHRALFEMQIIHYDNNSVWVLKKIKRRKIQEDKYHAIKIHRNCIHSHENFPKTKKKIQKKIALIFLLKCI